MFVILAIFGGSGLLLYAVGWLLVPEDGDNESEAQRLLNGRRTGGTVQTVVAGVVVLVLGLVVVAGLVDTGPGLGGLAAFVAVAALIVLVARSDRRPVPTMATGAPVAAGTVVFRASRTSPPHSRRRHRARTGRPPARRTQLLRHRARRPGGAPARHPRVPRPDYAGSPAAAAGSGRSWAGSR